MPKGRPRKNTIEIPPEGWGRCADCIAKNYEVWCYHLDNEADSSKKVSGYEKIMEETEKEFDACIRREKAKTNYDPNEHTCICCDYEKEHKSDIVSGKETVITSKIEFKELCKEYMKKYKKVKRIPITSRKTKIKNSKDLEDDDI